MSFLNDCFNTMLEYGEAVKSSFAKGHVSDWPEEKAAEVETPEETVPEEDIVPEEDEVIEDVPEEPVEEGGEIPE